MNSKIYVVNPVARRIFAGPARLFAHNLEHQLSRPWSVIEIDEYYLLPGTQGQLLIHKGYGQ
jgi:hypothetical protein